MSSSESHEYQDDFYEYINAGSSASARVVAPLVVDWLSPKSLLDVGCGAGAWCRIWSETRVAEVFGVDGSYVDENSLLFPKENFRGLDLSKEFSLERKFDLVTSLEVAEHVPLASSKIFVENLVRHGDVVLFSAAVPGQGGEFHVNEQPLEFWRELFREQGFDCYDPLRPGIVADGRVEPWYRYNTLLYVRRTERGRLPSVISASEVPQGTAIPEVSPWSWRTRNAILRRLPQSALDGLVKAKHFYGRATKKGAL